jgi:signal transduction histidine kinase
VIDLAYGGAVGGLVLSTLSVVRLRTRLAKRGAGVFLALTVVLTYLHSFCDLYSARKIWLLLTLLYVFATVVMLFLRWKKKAGFESNLLLGAAVVSLSLGVYDHIVVVYTRNGYQDFALARFSILFFMLAMSVAMTRRFVRSLQIAKKSQLRTKENLSRAMARLDKVNAEQKQAQIDAALISERQRIMRDMHDGFGSQLAGMLSQVKGNPPSREAMEAQIRELIDELRLTIDALEPVNGDLGSVLGSLRYRLEHRFFDSGIELEWDVTELPQIKDMSPVKVQHLQRIILEAFTNIVKHSGANRVAVSTQVAENSAFVHIRDNGTGFDADREFRGRGLKNMRSRAQESGIGFIVQSSTAGTLITMKLAI